MTQELSGKVAVVTGGAVRVGRALSLALADAGCDLFIHYGRSATEAAETKAEAEARGITAHTYSADLSDAEATVAVIEAAREAFGRVDILINSAALFLEGGLAETTLDMWEIQFAVNLRAPFLLSQAFSRQLVTGQEGQIVNIGDARIFRPDTDHFAYRLTKSALITMTEMLALELAPHVRVNAVALGAILPPPGEEASYLRKLAEEAVPLRRAGGAQIVAENVLHLLRQDFLTGVTIKIDGGQFL